MSMKVSSLNTYCQVKTKATPNIVVTVNITIFQLSSSPSALEKKSEIMGIKHTEYPIYGIQYHPESFASEGGKEIITNFLML